MIGTKPRQERKLERIQVQVESTPKQVDALEYSDLVIWKKK